MSLVRSSSQLSMGGADDLPHYKESLQIPSSPEQPLPARAVPYNAANASSRPATTQWHSITCPGVPAAGHGTYGLNAAMSSAIGTPVHPHGLPAVGSMTPMGSLAPPCVIGTPINAASTAWRTRVCPNAPIPRSRFGPPNVSSSPEAPLNIWPSSGGTPVTPSSTMSCGPNPDALRFAICGAKLDLAGASARTDAPEKKSQAFGQCPVTVLTCYPVWGETKGTDTVPTDTPMSRRSKGQLWRHASGADTIPESPDPTSLDLRPLIDVLESESPEKRVAPVRVKSHACNMQKLGSKDSSRFYTN
eukprot:TRINITY_DN106860_c0_g1_i1.p1 TRINITY_DN106860_c0_g1~~TRINITY_DN106860_c0_g1_i1.p1  ORF type:complete len:303 (-),score=25.19 TRINITY_DN106860_c0_g1_i1:3-911(-)